MKSQALRMENRSSQSILIKSIKISSKQIQLIMSTETSMMMKMKVKIATTIIKKTYSINRMPSE
jgi:hypothetical protein